MNFDTGADGWVASINLVEVASPPSATTNAATNITTSGAQMNGTINPNGASTTAYFQYGATTSYGSSSGVGSFGSGTSSIAINTVLSGVSPNTTFHYRVVATNSGGTTYGSDRSFTTTPAQAAPSATTQAATNVTANSAQMNGTINPNGASTTAYFQYGTTTSYGGTTGSTNFGSGTSSISISATNTGLNFNTTFHYRVVATSSGGTTYGSDRTFTTLPAPAPPNILAPGSASSPGVVLGTLTPIFNWNAVSGATGYGLYIRDLTTDTLIFNNDGGPKSGTSFTLPSGLLSNNGHSYRWAMTSFANGYESAQGSYLYFRAPTVTVYTLTVASSNPGSGVYVYVGPNDNQGLADGTTSFSRQYNSGTSVTLIAPTASGGNNFVKWTQNGSDYSVDRTITFSLSGSNTMTAVFAAAPPVTHTVTVSSSNPNSGVSIGSSTLDNNGNAGGTTTFTRIFNQNTVATYVAPATAGGNNFQKWQRDGVDLTTSTTASVTLDANHTLTAVYVAPTNSLGEFTLSNQTPYWDSNAPAGPAVRLNWTPSTGAANYDVYRNGSLYAGNLAGTTYMNNLNLTGGQTYSYYIVAKSSSGTRQSNTLSILMPTAPQTQLATLTSVTVNGSSSIAAGGSAAYTATAQFSSGSAQDVTELAQWNVSGGPNGTQMQGANLSAGSGTASTAIVTAIYGDNSGTKSGSRSVAIGTGLSVTATSALPQSLGGNGYRVDLSATSSGGNGTVTFAWDLPQPPNTNGDGVYGDLSGASAQWTLTSTGGTYQVKVRATDSQGGVAYATRSVTIDKSPVPNQPEKLAPAVPVGGGTMRNSSGLAMTYDTVRRDVGLIVLTHGLYSTKESDKQWLKDMAKAIEQELPKQGKEVPNVAFYDWGAVTNPADSAYTNAVIDLSANLGEILGELGAQTPATIALLLAGGASAQDFLWDLKYIRPIGQSHGQILATYLWLESQAVPPRINKDKPVHLIGHSAGGFVMGECAQRLKQLGFTVDLVTMLDTPAPFPGHLKASSDPTRGYPNPGTVERYISSAFGSVTSPGLWLTFPGSYYRREFLDRWKRVTIDAHSDAHKWYLNNTILGREQSGFYNSPFLHGPQVDHAQQSAEIARDPFLALTVSGAKMDSLPTAITTSTYVAGFSTFGSVNEISGTYTLTEQADAGIYKEITVPPGVERLRFKYKFSGTGDGDFLGVRFGTRAEIYLGLDLSISRDGFLETEVELGAYAGVTDRLVFTLVSRGNPGAILEIKDIEITESDDPDGDGLSVAQELALGTSSQNADTDGDGWSDYYEVNTSHTNPTLADTDGDGVPDSIEAVAGTDPNSNSSVFSALDVSRAPDGSVTLRWNGVSGKTYRVIRSATPAFESFDVIATKITGVGAATSYTDPAVNLQGVRAAFYRVEVE